MNSPPDLEDVDFARDVPTEPADTEFLQRNPGGATNLLPHLDRLTRAVRSLGAKPDRRTAEGWAPFSLGEDASGNAR